MTATSSERTGSTGLMALIAATTMLFAALTSAYIVRRGLAGDWTPVLLPWAVPAGIPIMIAGSLVLEKGRRGATGLWLAGAGMGLLFLLMQGYGCYEMLQSGLSIAESPSAAFFCVLAGTFVLFIVGATAAIVVAAQRLFVAVYWHYLTVVWIYLMFLLYLRR